MEKSRGTLSTLLWRELQMLTGSVRFRAVVVLIIGLMTASALINSIRYGTEIRAFESIQAGYEAELEGVTISELAVIHHPAVKPPWKLAFVVDGGQLRAPNVYHLGLSPWSEPGLSSQHGPDHRLPAAESLDWLFCVRVVLSLAAFILGYDAVCGERQRVTSRLVLSYPVARWQALTAKLVAIWISLAAPFCVGALASLSITRWYGSIYLSGAGWVKVVLVTSLSLWAIGLFVLMALVISALNREAARSLAILALIWVTAVEVIPAASDLAVRLVQPMPSGLEIDQRLEDFREQAEREAGRVASWREPEQAKEDNYALERGSARIENQRYENQETWRRNLMLEQLGQRNLARDLASLSPMIFIQDLAERLVGSGAYRDGRFIECAWEFRDQLASHVEALDRADPESPHLLFFKDFLSTETADADALPRFELAESTVREGLRVAARPLLWLGVITACLIGAALVSFGRYDFG